MTTPFDFTSIADLGAFWDGTKSLRGGASMPGGGNFNSFNYLNDGGTSHNLSLLYQNLLGRNADPSGKKYWGDRIAAGTSTFHDVADAIKASNEYQGQQTAIAGGATAQELMELDTAYVSPFTSGSGSAVAGWKPGDAITSAIADSVASNYADHANKTVGDLPPGGGGDGGHSTTHDPRYDSLLDSFNTMQNTFSTQLSDLQKAYAQSQTDMQSMWDNVQWDMNRTNNPQVRGVRTQNELPGFQNRTGGTRGYFGRGGAGNMLKTSSLNI